MCAILVSERCGVQPSELRHMTVTQFWSVYNHPKDDKTGELKRQPRVPTPYKSEQDEFREWYEARRYPMWLIRDKWRQREEEREKHGQGI